jgi:hypothetical protein
LVTRISLDGVRIKTMPSRLNTADFARLRATAGDDRPAPTRTTACRAACGTSADPAWPYRHRRQRRFPRRPIDPDRVPALRPPSHPPLDGPLLHLIVDGVWDAELLAFEAGCEAYFECEIDDVEWQGGRM